MKSTSYILGFLCGLACVALVCLLARLIFHKKLLKSDYDERQKAIQGKGYKLGYFTQLILLAAFGVFDEMTGIKWAGLFPMVMICVWASIGVFTTYCILHDAYLSLCSKRKPLTIVFLAFGLVNLAVALTHLFDGSGFVTDGMLNLDFVNLLTGMACLYLGLLLILREIRERRTAEADE